MGNYIDIDYIQTTIGKTFTNSTTPTTAQVNKYITLAEKEFEQDVGSYLVDDYTEYPICGKDSLYVSNFPVNSITNLYKSNGHPTNPTYYEVESTDFRIVNSNSGKIRILSPRVGFEYKVIYNAGYSTETMPEDIKYLVFLYVMKYIFNNTILNTEGNFGDSQVIIDVDVYKEITGKSMYIDGLRAIDDLISNGKSKLLNNLKTYWVR
ncbi:MAG: hypothetical protein EOL97_09635 [Spirochaetia bacterium]|nr:hypothetical protein [Spirochaetia bacterium]